MNRSDKQRLAMLPRCGMFVPTQSRHIALDSTVVISITLRLLGEEAILLPHTILQIDVGISSNRSVARIGLVYLHMVKDLSASTDFVGDCDSFFIPMASHMFNNGAGAASVRRYDLHYTQSVWL
jgi:hypothetical protein